MKWPRDDQDLGAIFARAHHRGIRVMHMAATVADALRAAEAGANVIVAQGNEGGEHVGEIGTTVIVRQVVKAIAPIPVLAAGGLRRRGTRAALHLERMGSCWNAVLATQEAPVEAAYKRAVVAGGGDDTIVTTVSHTLSGRDWPGAWNAPATNPSSRHGWAGSLNSADAARRSGRDSTRPKSPTPITA